MMRKKCAEEMYGTDFTASLTNQRKRRLLRRSLLRRCKKLFASPLKGLCYHTVQKICDTLS